MSILQHVFMWWTKIRIYRNMVFISVDSIIQHMHVFGLMMLSHFQVNTACFWTALGDGLGKGGDWGGGGGDRIVCGVSYPVDVNPGLLEFVVFWSCSVFQIRQGLVESIFSGQEISYYRPFSLKRPSRNYYYQQHTTNDFPIFSVFLFPIINLKCFRIQDCLLCTVFQVIVFWVGQYVPRSGFPSIYDSILNSFPSNSLVNKCNKC